MKTSARRGQFIIPAADAHRGGEPQHHGSVTSKTDSVNSVPSEGAPGAHLGTLVCFRPCSADEALPIHSSRGFCSYFCEPPMTSEAIPVAIPEPPAPIQGTGWVGGGLILLGFVLAGTLGRFIHRKSPELTNITPPDLPLECPLRPGLGFICNGPCLCKQKGIVNSDCSASKAGSHE